jgi:hypothetical protein
MKYAFIVQRAQKKKVDPNIASTVYVRIKKWHLSVCYFDVSIIYSV